ncbi:L-threonylcarbamoyladenylate synthase [uncultured Eudoraea sp.]|uniref:L-threonylcarbamoyladenylate synthase n=1 Tax=uncultured Eudoraea sp. TaxID=1035614 RepID=UPI0026320686|nr:L-threonylcarbamoyladenylate synthase [uncultured Eudoraea sp.]
MSKKEIDNAIAILNEGGLILYPTDTVWGIGCDATNKEAVDQIFRLKKRSDKKTMICLVSNQFMLEQYVKQVPEAAYDIMDIAEKPITIIYDDPKGVAENLIADDNTLAIRVASDKFCKRLIQKFKRPIVSTSANIAGEPTPGNFSEISNLILKGVDYVVNLEKNSTIKSPSSIIKLGNNGTVKIIRK